MTHQAQSIQPGYCRRYWLDNPPNRRIEQNNIELWCRHQSIPPKKKENETLSKAENFILKILPLYLINLSTHLAIFFQAILFCVRHFRNSFMGMVIFIIIWIICQSCFMDGTMV